MKDIMSIHDHPVWEIYDQYRTTKLNIKYRSRILLNLKRWSKFFDISLAITAPTSAIAAIGFWSTKFGFYVWQILISITALLAFIKPFLSLTEKIELNEELLVAERSLEIDLYKIIILIKEKMCYDTIIQDKFLESLDKIKDIIQKDKEVKVNEKLREKFFEEVNRELPNEFFYIPQEY